jgi:hypothetical protein
MGAAPCRVQAGSAGVNMRGRAFRPDWSWVWWQAGTVSSMLVSRLFLICYKDMKVEVMKGVGRHETTPVKSRS